jgi:hypothetical protein
MATPTLGEMRFAQLVMKTEMRPRRRRRYVVDQTWRRIFDGAVVVTFVFFLFM